MIHEKTFLQNFFGYHMFQYLIIIHSVIVIFINWQIFQSFNYYLSIPFSYIQLFLIIYFEHWGIWDFNSS